MVDIQILTVFISDRHENAVAIASLGGDCQLLQALNRPQRRYDRRPRHLQRAHARVGAVLRDNLAHLQVGILVDWIPGFRSEGAAKERYSLIWLHY